MRDAAQGDDLVAALGTRTAVLMRGHGCVVTGADVRQGVFAVYFERNAALLATALGTRRRASLSDAETQRAGAMLRGHATPGTCANASGNANGWANTA